MPEQRYQRLEVPKSLEEKEKLIRRYIGKQVRISDWNFYSETNPEFVEGTLVELIKSGDRKFYTLELSFPHNGLRIFKLKNLEILEVIAS